MKLTEEDVRRIAREEIERHDAEQFENFKVSFAMNLEDWANRPPFAWMDAKGADAVTSD